MKQRLKSCDQLHPGEITSHSLLQRVREQDQESWRCLTQLYGPLIYHWCRKAGLSAEDAADALQDVFRKLVIHIRGFEKTSSGGTFRGWLWCITRNTIRDHFKARVGKAQATGGTNAQLQLSMLPDLEPDDTADSASSVTSGLTYRALTIVQSEFQEKTWRAFWRSTIDDVSPAIVADELGISIGSVYQAKSRALRRLRELLE